MSRKILYLLITLLLFFSLTTAAAVQQTEPAAGQGTQADTPQEEQETGEVSTYTLSPEKYEKAVAYARAQNILYFVSVAWGVIVVLLVLHFGLSVRFREWAEKVSGMSFVQALVFVPLLLLTLDVLDLPTSVIGHWLSVSYEQSVQGWGSWAWDWTKGEAIGLVIGVPLIWLLYFVIRRSPTRWWLYFWLASIPIILFLIWVVPTVVTPLFFEFEPLAETQPALVEEIERVVARTDLEIPRERMFEMKASEKLNTVNAYVTGFGTSKRVVVWDTTLEKMSTEQTLFVFGHEMGHYVLNHLLYGIIIAIVTTLIFLFAGYRGIHWMLGRWGGKWRIEGVNDWASFPALLLILAVLGFFASPFTNAVSRYREHEADIYGLEVVRGIVPESNRVAAEAFQVLGEINLADPDPSAFIKLWRYSHPPLSERVAFAYEYDPWSKGEKPRFVSPSELTAPEAKP